MRISTDGQHILSGVQGVILDGQLVQSNAGLSVGSADFVTDGLIWYGGWNVQPGRYASPLVSPAPTFVTADLANVVQGFWSDGAARWLVNASDGAHDSDGNFWPDRQALGSSRQGDWLFVNTQPYQGQSPFTVLIVRNAAGLESPYFFGAFFTLGGMDHGVICVQPAGGPVRLLGYTVPVTVPNPLAVAVSPFQTWLAGYCSGWGLCLARASQTPTGYLVSGDGKDFGPTIAVRNDGMIIVASGTNQGETVQRVYAIDPATMKATLNGSGPFALPLIDLMNPPQPPPPDVPPFKFPIACGVVEPSR